MKTTSGPVTKDQADDLIRIALKNEHPDAPNNGRTSDLNGWLGNDLLNASAAGSSHVLVRTLGGDFLEFRRDGFGWVTVQLNLTGPRTDPWKA